MTEIDFIDCAVCGEPKSRLIRSEDPPGLKDILSGVKIQTWKCVECGDQQVKKVKPDG
ncbi:hypothetical protein [Sulfitobacter mediterraneus]|uniref:hypothetical protein n=1 Tax=Sulfitobacter mediterraneus TaxID=83219 RepID=UPI000B1F2D75|nr:hypothetical protein [Sulfitobacter mediterraneus]